ncbi:hypothetical protein G9A89_004645 [Geosiphon pyriformis]|nr:hypothetical protein G9A89_004645 [Geosiphon pyriformis]
MARGRAKKINPVPGSTRVTRSLRKRKDEEEKITDATTFDASGDVIMSKESSTVSVGDSASLMSLDPDEDDVLENFEKVMEKPQKKPSKRVKVSNSIKSEEIKVATFSSPKKGKNAAFPTTVLAKATNKPAKQAKRKPKHRQVEYLITNPESMLVWAELKSFINMERFKSITEEQQERLLALVPNVDRVPKIYDQIKGEQADNAPQSYDNKVNFQEPEPTTSQLNTNQKNIEDVPNNTRNIKTESSQLKSNQTLRDIFFHNIHYRECVSDFQDKLKAGHYDPKWIKKNRAEQERLRKTINEEWKDVRFERQWGHNIAAASPSRAGESANISLQELCQSEIIRIGDELHYRRNFRSNNVTVDGVVQVTKIDSDGTMHVNGNLHGSKKKMKGEITWKITKLSSLETKVLDDDGQIPKNRRPNGNANKSFRVHRNGNDLGSIFALRSEYYNKLNE